MATMYPKDLSQYMPTDSERIVYQELKQQLPDNFSVFYSVKWSAYEQGRLIKSESDFIVESPDHGFLCLEVKGGSGVRVDGDTWYLEDNTYGERRLNCSPYDQARKACIIFGITFLIVTTHLTVGCLARGFFPSCYRGRYSSKR